MDDDILPCFLGGKSKLDATLHTEACSSSTSIQKSDFWFPDGTFLDNINYIVLLLVLGLIVLVPVFNIR